MSRRAARSSPARGRAGRPRRPRHRSGTGRGRRYRRGGIHRPASARPPLRAAAPRFRRRSRQLPTPIVPRPAHQPSARGRRRRRLYPCSPCSLHARHAPREATVSLRGVAVRGCAANGRVGGQLPWAAPGSVSRSATRQAERPPTRGPARRWRPPGAQRSLFGFEAAGQHRGLEAGPFRASASMRANSAPRSTKPSVRAPPHSRCASRAMSACADGSGPAASRSMTCAVSAITDSTKAASCSGPTWRAASSIELEIDAWRRGDLDRGRVIAAGGIARRTTAPGRWPAGRGSPAWPGDRPCRRPGSDRVRRPSRGR